MNKLLWLWISPISAGKHDEWLEVLIELNIDSSVSLGAH